MIGQVHRSILFRYEPVTNIECIIGRHTVGDFKRDTARKPICCGILPVQRNPVVSASCYMKILRCVARASAVKTIALVVAFKPVPPAVHMEFTALDPVRHPAYNSRAAGWIPSVFFQRILSQHQIIHIPILIRNLQILNDSTVSNNMGRHSGFVRNHHFLNIGTIRKCSHSPDLHFTFFSILPLCLPRPLWPAIKKL